MNKIEMVNHYFYRINGIVVFGLALNLILNLLIIRPTIQIMIYSLIITTLIMLMTLLTLFYFLVWKVILNSKSIRIQTGLRAIDISWDQIESIQDVKTILTEDRLIILLNNGKRVSTTRLDRNIHQSILKIWNEKLTTVDS